MRMHPSECTTGIFTLEFQLDISFFFSRVASTLLKESKDMKPLGKKDRSVAVVVVVPAGTAASFL
jgi:hypothetical protein